MSLVLACVGYLGLGIAVREQVRESRAAQDTGEAEGHFDHVGRAVGAAIGPLIFFGIVITDLPSPISLMIAFLLLLVAFWQIYKL
jgi:hypothetical protein